MTRRLRALVACGAIVLASSRAHAEDDSLDTTAEARFKEGVAFAREGKYEQARISFLQTLALSPGSPKVLLNLAISEHGAGRFVEALSHLKGYLAHPKVDPKKAAEVRQSLHEELWRATGHLRIRAARGDAVVLDGETKLGNAPLDDVVDVMPGRHRITTGARSQDLIVAPGETTDVSLDREPPDTVPVRPHEASRAAAPRADAATRHEASFWGVRSIGGVVLLTGGAVAAIVGATAMADESSANQKLSHLANALPPGESGSRCFGVASPVCSDYRDARAARDEADARSIWLPIGIGGAVVGAALLASAIVWPHPRGRATSSVVPTRLAPLANHREASLLFISSF